MNTQLLDSTEVANNPIYHDSVSAVMYNHENFMHEVFYVCVDILKAIAWRFGVTYEEANVWIFVIIGPILFGLLAIYAIYLSVSLFRLRKRLRILEASTANS